MVASSRSLRLIDPAVPLEPVVVDVPSTEIAPGTTLDDDGALHIEHEDGSVDIDFDPPEDEGEEDNNGFDANLAGKLSEDRLSEISSLLLEGIDRDIESRKEWLETRARGVQLLGLKLEEPRGDVGQGSAPLEGMSTVRHPLLLEATIRFQATARGELLPATGPVKIRNDTPQRPPQPPQPEAQSPPADTSGGAAPADASGSTGPAPPAFSSSPPPAPAPAPGTPPAPAGAAPQSGQSAPPPTPPPAPAPAPAASEQPSPATAQEQAPFATEYAVPKVQAADSLADALETDFNHYLTVTAPEYVPDTDRMLFYVGFGGDGFKKVFNCPLRLRPVSESVDAEDLIISNSATDIRNCVRVTHRIKKSKSFLRRMQILGAYRDVELTTPVPTSVSDNPLQKEKEEIDGVNPVATKSEDLDYTIYESCCELDLDEFAPLHFKNKGLPLPYRVTVEKDSRKILSIVRNWKEDDEQCMGKQYFVQFPFIRGLGFYGLGLVHLLGQTTSALTAMSREMVDGGMFANFPGFLYAKAAGRQLSNQFRVPPGGGIGLDVPLNMRIQDMVMQLPYHEPGAGFLGIYTAIEQAGQRLGQTAEISIGEGKQDAPVGTTLALIEQATKLLDSVHKRLHWAQNEEFALLKERFKEDPEAFWRHNPKPAVPWEREQFLRALDNYNLVPVADPNNPTSLHRAAKAAAIEALAAKYPQLINAQAALERIFRITGIDSEGLFHPEPLPPPPDPRMVAISQKASTATETAQSQLQQAVVKAMVALKQLEAQTADNAQKTQMEQVRLMLETGERNNKAQQDQAKAAAEIQTKQVTTAQDLQAKRAETAMKLRASQEEKAQQLQADMITQAQEQRLEAASRAQDMHLGAAERGHDMMKEQATHRAEMQRAREQHLDEMQRKREAHQAELEMKREAQTVELAHKKALARITKKSDTKKKA